MSDLITKNSQAFLVHIMGPSTIMDNPNFKEQLEFLRDSLIQYLQVWNIEIIFLLNSSDYNSNITPNLVINLFTPTFDPIIHVKNVKATHIQKSSLIKYYNTLYIIEYDDRLIDQKYILITSKFDLTIDDELSMYNKLLKMFPQTRVIYNLKDVIAEIGIQISREFFTLDVNPSAKSNTPNPNLLSNAIDDLINEMYSPPQGEFEVLAKLDDNITLENTSIKDQTKVEKLILSLNRTIDFINSLPNQPLSEGDKIRINTKFKLLEIEINDIQGSSSHSHSLKVLYLRKIQEIQINISKRISYYLSIGGHCHIYSTEKESKLESLIKEYTILYNENPKNDFLRRITENYNSNPKDFRGYLNNKVSKSIIKIKTKAENHLSSGDCLNNHLSELEQQKSLLSKDIDNMPSNHVLPLNIQCYKDKTNQTIKQYKYKNLLNIDFSGMKPSINIGLIANSGDAKFLSDNNITKP